MAAPLNTKYAQAVISKVVCEATLGLRKDSKKSPVAMAHTMIKKGPRWEVRNFSGNQLGRRISHQVDLKVAACSEGMGGFGGHSGMYQAVDGGGQAGFVHGFGQDLIHARLQTLLTVLGVGAGGQADHGDMTDGIEQLLAYGLTRLRAIHAGHEHVHQHHIELRLLQLLK